MNEQIEKHINEILEMLKSGIDFASEQAPIFIQEILTYAIYEHSIKALLFIVMSLIALYVMLGCKYSHEKESIYDFTEWGLGRFIAGFTSMVFIILSVHHVVQVVKVTIAPRLYLIETISNLL